MSEEPVNVLEPGAAPTAHVDRPITCAGCGYNLFHLAADGNCPECGKPVADSLKDRLELQPADVLRSASRGLMLMLVATVLSPGCIGMSLVAVVTWDADRSQRAILVAVGTSAVFFATLAVSVASDARLWAGPHGARWLEAGRRRALKGWSLCAGAGLLVLAIVPWLALAVGSDTRSVAVAVWFAFVLLTASIPRFPLYYRSLARLAESIPRHGLRKGLTGMGRTKLVTDGILVGAVAAALTFAPMESAISIWAAVVAFLALPLYALVWIPTAVLHVRLFLAVRKVAVAAGALTSEDVGSLAPALK